jgi:hypothetical protein
MIRSVEVAGCNCREHPRVLRHTNGPRQPAIFLLGHAIPARCGEHGSPLRDRLTAPTRLCSTGVQLGYGPCRRLLQPGFSHAQSRLRCLMPLLAGNE